MEQSICAIEGAAQGLIKQRLILTLALPDKRVINEPYAGEFDLVPSWQG